MTRKPPMPCSTSPMADLAATTAKRLILLVALSVFGFTAAYAQDNSPFHALIYKDGDPQLELLYGELESTLSAHDLIVTTTSSIDDFSNLLVGGETHVYAAFSTNAALLETWKNLVPDGAKYLSFTLDQVNENAIFEYHSFTPVPMPPLVVGERLTIVDGNTSSSGVFSTVAPASVPSTLNGQTKNLGELIGGVFDFFGQVFTDLLGGVVCIVDWTGGCLADLAEKLKAAGVTVKATNSATASPPGGQLQVYVEGTFDKILQTIKAAGEFVVCELKCLGACSGGK